MKRCLYVLLIFTLSTHKNAHCDLWENVKSFFHPEERIFSCSRKRSQKIAAANKAITEAINIYFETPFDNERIQDSVSTTKLIIDTLSSEEKKILENNYNDNFTQFKSIQKFEKSEQGKEAREKLLKGYNTITNTNTYIPLYEFEYSLIKEVGVSGFTNPRLTIINNVIEKKRTSTYYRLREFLSIAHHILSIPYYRNYIIGTGVLIAICIKGSVYLYNKYKKRK